MITPGLVLIDSLDNWHNTDTYEICFAERSNSFSLRLLMSFGDFYSVSLKCLQICRRKYIHVKWLDNSAILPGSDMGKHYIRHPANSSAKIVKAKMDNKIYFSFRVIRSSPDPLMPYFCIEIKAQGRAQANFFVVVFLGRSLLTEHYLKSQQPLLNPDLIWNLFKAHK